MAKSATISRVPRRGFCAGDFAPGQPNVGKSSLLNALFGTQKVRASRTPGKVSRASGIPSKSRRLTPTNPPQTKHFQTLFWTPEVRLVDCPGLVVPNYVPMEDQVRRRVPPPLRRAARLPEIECGRLFTPRRS